jgi:hypothetical protein
MNKEPINVTVPFETLCSILCAACNLCANYEEEYDDEEIIEDIETDVIPAIIDTAACVKAQITIPDKYSHLFEVEKLPYINTN